MGTRLLFLVLSVMLLAGCARTWDDRPPVADAGGVALLTDGTVAEGPEVEHANTTASVRNGAGLVPPFGTDGVPAAYEYGTGYRIGSGDRLTVKVLGQVDLTGEYIVDGSGAISMPLVNSIKVAGLTAPQTERLIAGQLRNGFLRDPSVAVQVTTSRPFYILGEVNQAGSYPYQAGITVQHAIAIANGYTARADQGKVLITRIDANGTRSRPVPLTTQINPGDIVYVRERWF